MRFINLIRQQSFVDVKVMKLITRNLLHETYYTKFKRYIY